LALLLAALQEAVAQYDPSFSHYWALETAYNPAAAGKQDKLNIMAAYNMSMVGFEHNPRTIFATADMPFYFAGAYHGVGAQLMNDDIGAFSHKKFSVIYAYKQKLFGGTLSIGLQPGFLSETLNGSKLDFEESSDEALPTSDVTGTAFDLSAGLYYQRKWWYLGAAVQHAMSPKVELGETNELDVDRTYYLMAGCNIRFRNPFLSIQPSVMGRSDGVGYRADITARMTYTHEGKVMYAGVGYSPTNSVSVYVGGTFHGIMLGYSYEMYTTALSIGNGSHELYVGYQTDINLFKKGRNRHQSVRIL
jgi:type IX secretion system PorP/SprF family membrane protein